jgi:hypothetical protein
MRDDLREHWDGAKHLMGASMIRRTKHWEEACSCILGGF